MTPDRARHSAIVTEDVARMLADMRVDLATEAACQADIETMLAMQFSPSIAVSREHRLGPRCRPDFLIDGRIVVEVKVGRAQSKWAVLAQLERYAAFAEVEAVILATGLAMGLPDEIGGKPAFVVSLGRAWV